MSIRKLLILWLAVIGCDRIDLLNGVGDFVLTPYLILSIVVIALYCLKNIFYINKLNNIRVTDKVKIYLILSSLFLITVLLSVIFSHDIDLSLKRYILLIYEIIITSIIFWIIININDYDSIILKGSILGIIIFFGFTIVEYINWIATITGMSELIKLPFFDFTPWTEGFFLRNAGVSLDPNRGGFLLNIYWFNVSKLNKNIKSMNFLAIFLLILTISKTAIIMFLTINLILFYQEKKKATIIKNTLIYGFGILVILILIFKITNISINQEDLDVENLVQSRFEVSEGSSGGTHIALIQRAFSSSMESTKNILVGNGFGASYNILLEFFPFALDKLKNFHSTYLTFLAESGILSLIIFLIYTLYPISFNKKYAPVVIGIAMFNIFYQIHLEPMFWFCNLMAWFYVGSNKPELLTT